MTKDWARIAVEDLEPDVEEEELLNHISGDGDFSALAPILREST